ncbi:MAG: adenylyltransferase/cytidyltransferase family protein [Candidatus Peribacteraceae bacterium]|jgi:FAD synthetase|nr:FAD synthase [bacterium]MDP6561615.1 adenylyltransferase/cytidyltransferase family protein [Candidatus Peribacteraceae bacterium]|tara:strand:+ start:5244 stop:5669 length:426 start_codon:yes stop_codon:yes gene_type:complete
MKVLTFGTFDHLHPGHLAFLKEASSNGELFISVARDANVKEIKGIAPDQSEGDRVLALKNAFPKANITLGDAQDYLKPVRDISPDLIVLGYDQKLPPGVSQEDLSCEIQRAAPFDPDIYKSSIRRKLIPRASPSGTSDIDN